METNYWQAVFSENEKSCFKMKKNYFSYCNLCVFSSYLCSFIGFDYWSFDFGAFLTFWRNPEIQDGGSKMAAIWQSWRYYASYDDISFWCGKSLWTFYVSSKSRCHSFHSCKVMEGVESYLPPDPKRNKPDLDRVILGGLQESGARPFFCSLQVIWQSIQLEHLTKIPK